RLRRPTLCPIELRGRSKVKVKRKKEKGKESLGCIPVSASTGFFSDPDASARATARLANASGSENATSLRAETGMHSEALSDRRGLVPRYADAVFYFSVTFNSTGLAVARLVGV